MIIGKKLIGVAYSNFPIQLLNTYILHIF